MATLKRMTAVLLAFDSSTEELAVALQWPGGTRAWNGPGGAQASANLLPCIRELMCEAALQWSDLDAIAFGRGPGAFTGLRTACAVAQGLAFAAAKPVLPIDSLLIVAEDACAPWTAAQSSAASPSALARPFEDDASDDPRRGSAQTQARHTIDVGVVMDARMGEVYAAHYRRTWEPLTTDVRTASDRQAARGQAGPWRTVHPPSLCAPSALRAMWASPPVLWAGTGLALIEGFAVPAARPTADRAAALLRLADQAWRDGQAVEVDQALPVYLRDKVALTVAERAAVKAATQAPSP